MNTLSLIIPPVQTMTLGSMPAVIDVIDPSTAFPIKGNINDEEISWNTRGICKEHAGDELYNLQLGQDEILLVLDEIRKLKKR